MMILNNYNLNIKKNFTKKERIYYEIFNKFHYKYIANKNIDNQQIKEFFNKGFFKTNIDSVDFAKYISSQIKYQSVKPENFSFYFDINNEMKNEIKSHVNNKFGNLLRELEKLYNSKITIAKIAIKRNLSIEKNINKEFYSNFYHLDSCVYTHFKLFINLSDIKINQGPLHIYSKKDTKKFIKVNKYKSRNNYVDNELNELLIKNTGRLGESFIANTSECLHKAGSVEKGYQRDVIVITFIVTPEVITNKGDNFFFYEKKYPESIWLRDRKIIKIVKPKSLISIIKLFFKYYKNKLN